MSLDDYKRGRYDGVLLAIKAFYGDRSPGLNHEVARLIADNAPIERRETPRPSASPIDLTDLPAVGYEPDIQPQHPWVEPIGPDGEDLMLNDLPDQP